MSYQLLDTEKRILVREDSKAIFRGINKIIFDFDGVLAQTSQSYRQTIRKVLDYYFLEILGLEGEKGKLSTLEDIQKFKDTGIYNNDWKLSYTFIAYYMNLILETLEQKDTLQGFKKKYSSIQFSDVQSFIKNLKEVGNFLRCNEINGTKLATLKEDKIVGLEQFLAHNGFENQNPINISNISNDPKVVEAKEMLVKILVPYDLEKPDLLKRLFEETYLGKELYTRIYSTPAFFNFDSSLLNIEKFIPTKDTMNLLRNKFGTFGIYSGRPKPQGMYILEKYNYKEYFNEKESVFLGDLLKSEEDMKKLGKPDPTLFIELIKKNVDKRIVYVGDGISDAILIEKAKEQGLENLCFLGVMSSSENSNKLFTEYSKHGADAIVTDVNDIPFLFASLGGNMK